MSGLWGEKFGDFIDSSSTFVDFFPKLKGTWEVLKTEFTICICGCGAAVVQNNLVLLP